MSFIPSPRLVLPNTKPHYHILDGLRGVAALMVLIYHVGEAFATSPATQWCNHGYLAVQFFFVLSGFVIGYAYDDRWKQMSVATFFKRRLIRLHPMVIVGAIFGVVAFLLQGSVKWDGQSVPLSLLGGAFVLTILMIPISPTSIFDVRGNGELFPLNGPQWSLFMEYIGNIVYALILRRMSTRVVACFTGILGIGCAYFAIGNFTGFGQLGPGWTMEGNYFWGGMMCMMFCFSAGLLVSRIFQPLNVKGSFWICTLAIVGLLGMPYIGTEETAYLNGLYDTMCVLFIFPILVWIGASGHTTDQTTTTICNFWGDVSYPVYIIHYPSMYLFYAWVWNNSLTLEQVWPAALGIIVGNIILAWVIFKAYDQPVRQWLSRLFLKH